MSGVSDLIFIALALEVVVVLVLVARLGLLALVAFGAINTAAGLFVLANQAGESSQYAWIFVLGNVSILIGYACRSLRDRSRVAEPMRVTGREEDLPEDHRRVREGALGSTAVIVALLALYHLWAVGFPVFASDVEVQRFDFTSSGLFGIPGRMYLFGVPIVWAITTAAVVDAGKKFLASRAWVIASLALLLTSLLGGFKSGVAAMATTVIIVMTITQQSQPRLLTAIRQYWWLVLGAVVYGAIVASSYVTYQRQGGSLIDQLISRLTVIGAEPKRAALLGSVQTPPAPLFSDFWYFIRKYAGQSTSSDFTVERAISAAMIGADPASNAWTTPVTVGGIPELVLVLGTPIAMVACSVLGWILSGLYRLRSPSFSKLAVASIAGLALTTWISRGGFAYYTLNYLLVGLLVFLLYRASRLTVMGVSRRRSVAVLKPRQLGAMR